MILQFVKKFVIFPVTKRLQLNLDFTITYRKFFN